MDLTPWGAPALGARLDGGHRNEVYRVGDDWVVRRSRRSVASLEWELDLLDHLSQHGFLVPGVVPTRDGRRHVDGVVMQRWLPGREPSDGDWPLVVAELRRLHALMTGWPPRPDFPGTRELLTVDQGGDVDLASMPAEVVARCRKAWRGLDGPLTVIHGDPCAANIRVVEERELKDRDGEGRGPERRVEGTETGGEQAGRRPAVRIGFLDWDEARVDNPWLDLADIPGVAAIPGLGVPTAAKAAVDAWETVNAWVMEPPYARRRLARLAVDKSVDN